MSRTDRPGRPPLHDYRIGELVILSAPIAPLERGTILQIVAYRGPKLLRLLPLGGIPIIAHHKQVRRADLPCGSQKPPQRRRFHRKRRPKPAPPPTTTAAA
jgi:hypothetical protein